MYSYVLPFLQSWTLEALYTKIQFHSSFGGGFRWCTRLFQSYCRSKPLTLKLIKSCFDDAGKGDDDDDDDDDVYGNEFRID